MISVIAQTAALLLVVLLICPRRVRGYTTVRIHRSGWRSRSCDATARSAGSDSSASTNTREADTTCTPSTPLRPARDVIHRITYDAEIPTEHFRFGYRDRFDGVLDATFEAPNVRGRPKNFIPEPLPCTQAPPF